MTPVSVNVGNADQLSRVRNLSRAHLFRVFFSRITDRKLRQLPLRRVVLLLWLMKEFGPDRLNANGTRGSSRDRVHGELYMSPIDVWSPPEYRGCSRNREGGVPVKRPATRKSSTREKLAVQDGSKWKKKPSKKHGIISSSNRKPERNQKWLLNRIRRRNHFLFTAGILPLRSHLLKLAPPPPQTR